MDPIEPVVPPEEALPSPETEPRLEAQHTETTPAPAPVLESEPEPAPAPVPAAEPVSPSMSMPTPVPPPMVAASVEPVKPVRSSIPLVPPASPAPPAPEAAAPVLAEEPHNPGSSWGVIIAIFIMLGLMVVGAFYAWGKRISQDQTQAANVGQTLLISPANRV